jgi:hypothetical protein
MQPESSFARSAVHRSGRSSPPPRSPTSLRSSSARGGARRPPARRAQRARGHHASGKAGRRRPTRGAPSQATRPHPRPARRDRRELAVAGRHDRARSPPSARSARTTRALARDRARVRRSRAARDSGLGCRVPQPPPVRPHDRVRLLRRLGVAAEDVVAAARETSADLVVLAWNQELGEGRARVVSETLAHSSIPVLLLPVPSGQGRSGHRGQHSVDHRTRAQRPTPMRSRATDE